MSSYKFGQGLCVAGSSLAVAVAIAAPSSAQIQTIAFDIDAQALPAALLTFGRQAGLSVLAPADLVAGKTAPAVRGQLAPAAALEQLLAGTGLNFEFVNSGAVRILSPLQRSSAPSGASVETASSNDRVIITGTNIAGVQTNFSPIEVYTADDIERMGVTTTEEFVGRLPQNLGTLSHFAVGSTNTGVNADGVNAIDLRGLGIGTTLTLLNGRRMALSSSGRSADVSFIPAAAIERVDVLTDGASAIYGSDAVGGVVNFVLRKDFEGAETRLSLGGVTRGGLRQTTASQVLGAKWAGGHGLASYNFHSASALKTTDRNYAAAAGRGKLTPVDQRHNLFGTITQDLTDQLRLDADIGYSHRKVKNAFSNLVVASLAQTYASTDSETDQAFGSIALNYAIAEKWSADVSASYSELDTDSFVSLLRFNRIPPFATLGDNSTNNSQLDVMGKITGAVMSLPGGDMRFTIGAGALEEHFKGVSSSTGRQSAGELGRVSTYGFAEVYAPIVGADQNIPMMSRLAVSLAARYTDYKDDSRPSVDREFGDSVDPKLSLLWAPVDGLNFRATYGTSFRAPSLTQLDRTGGSHFLLPQAVLGSPAILLSLNGYAVADLGPETATTYTTGFDYQPEASGFRLSATYYNIDYTDRIGAAPIAGVDPFASPSRVPDLIYRPPSAEFIAAVLQESPLSLNLSGVDLSNPTTAASTLFARPDVWIFDTRLKNLAVSQQDGIDISASQSFSTAWGDLQLGANATHILGYEQQGSVTAPIVRALDLPGQPVDWRGRAFASLSSGAFSGTLNVNYTDSYSNPQAVAAFRKIDSWTTTDLNLSYAFGAAGSAGGQGTRLSLNVQNLFDVDPPSLRTGSGSNIIMPIGFDPANANPLGRLVTVGFSHTW